MVTKKYLKGIADYLHKRSREICLDNNCTEDNHNCESYAYFDIEYNNDKLIKCDLRDICGSDCATRMYDSMICLPFKGNYIDLENEIKENFIQKEEVTI